MNEMQWMMDHYSPQQVIFLLVVKMMVVCFALYGTWQLRKAAR